MTSKIIPSITAEVLAASSGIPVADNSLEVVAILGTFSRGPMQTPVSVSDVAQAALQFGDMDDTSKANFLTGMWAAKLVMDQGAQRVILIRVGPAVLASLTLTDLVTDTVTGIESAGAGVVVEMDNDPIVKGFLVGQLVTYDPGGANEEITTIDAISATDMTMDLANSHVAGETIQMEASVVKLDAAPGPGQYGNLYTVAVAAGTAANTVKLTIIGDGKQEVWDDLNNTPGTPRYLVDFLKANSTLVTPTALASSNLPAVLAATNLTGGADGNVTTDADYIGVATPAPTGSFVFNTIDANLLTAAGQDSANVHAALVARAGEKEDRIAIVGGALAETVIEVQARASALAADRAVLCNPGIKVFDQNRDEEVTLSAAYFAHQVAGVLGTLDPYRSPSNKQVVNFLGFEKDVNDADLATLIQSGVVTGTKKGRLGFRIRNGNTTTISYPFSQINIRRLFDQIVRGIEESNQELVSEPNNEDTQFALEQGINDFLDRLQDQGAIQAFFTNVFSTPADQKAGFLFADVGIFPTFAADFIVIRIKPDDTGSFVTELASA